CLPLLRCLARSREPLTIPPPHAKGLNPERLRRSWALPPLRRDDRITWIHDHGDPCGAWDGFLEKLQALLSRFPGHGHHPRDVPARPGQIGYEPCSEGVSDLDYDDRNGFRGGNGGVGSRRVGGDDEANVEMQQLLSEAA